MANFTCPNGAPEAWRSCAGGSRFVGCCMSDPCDLGCMAGALIPASFNPDLYGKIPDLACDSGAQFYTCAYTSPPFWGCCKSNPCSQGGCPQEDLSPANLGSNPRVTAYYSPTGAPASTASATSTPAPAHSDNTVIAAAVGGAVGGCLLIGLLVLLIWWRRRRSQQQRDPIGSAPITEVQNPPPDAYGYTRYSELSASKSVSLRVSSTPPPRYSTIQHKTEIFELEEQSQNPSAPKIPMEEAVELDAGTTPQSLPSSAKSNRRFTGHRLSSSKRPAPLDLSSEEASEISPQSAQFGQNRESHPYSHVSSLSPHSPRSPHSIPGRPSPTYPPAITEDEPEFFCRIESPSFTNT